MIRILNQYVSPKSLLLIALEGVLIVAGLLCGARIRFLGSAIEFNAYVQAPQFVLQLVLFVVTFQVCFYYSDLYDLRALRGRQEELICLGQSLGAASLFLGLMYFVFPSLLIGRGVFFIGMAVVTTLVIVARMSLERAWRVVSPQKILILGTKELAITAANELTLRRDLNVKVAGFLEPCGDTGARAKQGGFSGRILGNMDDVLPVVEEHQISRIVVAMEDARGCLPIRDLVRLRVQGVRVEDAHSTVSALSGRIWLNMVRPSWFIFSDGFRRSGMTLVLKRMIDLAAGLTGLVFSAPLMLLVAVAVRLDSKGPAIYAQTRVGFRGKEFKVLKFRSMRVDAEAHSGAQWAQKDDQRVTRVGRYLRKYRLDELPQFINVIRGEMSFVGPRPERPVFVERLRDIISYYDERHSVRPGLTGWAQVQFSYGASVEDACRKLEYDLFYLKNMSVLFDAVIIVKTIRIMLTGRGGR
jgi:sugar transferase (PEP-CTERM system associated)